MPGELAAIYYRDPATHAREAESAVRSRHVTRAPSRVVEKHT